MVTIVVIIGLGIGEDQWQPNSVASNSIEPKGKLSTTKETLAKDHGADRKAYSGKAYNALAGGLKRRYMELLENHCI